VNERGGLQRLVGRFVRHFLRSQAAQLIVNKGEEPSGGLGISLFDVRQNPRDIAHGYVSLWPGCRPV
jgi:hypothetical protein